MEFEEGAGLFVIGDATKADAVFCGSAVFAVKARKGTADAVVVDLYIQVFDLGLIG
jgi:hypothetical protein